MNEGLMIDTPRDTFRVVAATRPFSTERVDLELEEGRTILEILRDAGVSEHADARVFVGDILIPRKHWGYVRPKRGSVVTIRAIPTGGGGNGDSNKTLRTVFQVVVLIAAVVLNILSYGATTPLTMAAFAALSVGVAVGGNLLVMALPPPRWA
jgi:hypothetical protein